ncbi:Alkaline phosphatase [Mycena indigotica]|uniref:alkaline phosphatase n=1 Tax=Mycena indigotica TaxID=2126181 RepID=A0A8H6S2G2_9AGAR|nr:Alkaline phosphatase [Mycena indigotica]KAF7291995.1 Alkaline phosphatase [Mycena indigotica]
MRALTSAVSLVVSLASLRASALTFTRLGACPSLGCVFPPDQASFLPGQYFDVRLEVHAPVNGTEAFNGGIPDEKFTFCIQEGKGKCEEASKFFKSTWSDLQTYNFTYYQDQFALDASSPTVVNAAARSLRGLSLKKPGTYKATLKYYNGQTTVATWFVRETPKTAAAKNVLFFIGDGMTQSMITAARVLAHKSVNGVYQSLMQMDQMEALGHQMTHSIDSYITDSANSATALYTGKKTTVDALNVYADSSPTPFDDPKFETIAELFRRKRKGPIGMVSTAHISDATPAGLCSHTRSRGEYASIVYEYLNGAQARTPEFHWPTSCEGPDVIFGGGAEQFFPGSGSYNGTDMYKAYAAAGYQLVYNNTQLQSAKNNQKTLGIFSTSVLPKWIDRNIYPKNLVGLKNSPLGDGGDALDQPGLKAMTLKAIDILQARSKKSGTGWFMMSEAASIDKMMHALDYDRALGELLELDDTIRASLAHLEKIGELKNTLVVVTADHGHGFDVFGSADTKYLASQTTDRQKRKAIGVYGDSGLSGYTMSPDNSSFIVGAQGPNFPVTWTPRYAFAAGTAAFPDHRESYAINQSGPRVAAVSPKGSTDGYVVNPVDQQAGFTLSGNLPPSEGSGVHSLTDVSVFANGPGAETFRGVYNSIDVFFKMANALGLGAH